MGAVKRFFGGAKVKKGPSAAEIRAQEEAKARKRAQKQIQDQEAKRAALRGTLDEDEEGDIQRKKLFGE